MSRSLFDPPPVVAPVLSPDTLQALANEMLQLTTGDTAYVSIDHTANGIARAARGRIRLNSSGDRLTVSFMTRFGQRVPMFLSVNQIDSASLRETVAYVDSIAREQPGDPIETAMPTVPKHYVPSAITFESSVAAFSEGRHAAIQSLVQPVIESGLIAAAFVGVMVRSHCVATKQGLMVSGMETDTEVTVTGLNPDGRGSGWAGEAARDWRTVRPEQVSQQAIRLTKLAANPQMLEPGRRTAILDRAAVVQLVTSMGTAFAASPTFSGAGPLYDRKAQRVRFGQRIVDARLTMSSDPNDPEGGYLPFNESADPLVPMTWLGEGAVLKNLAFDPRFAAEMGVTPSNDAPDSFRITGGTTTVDEMIANCKEGIYVNRVVDVRSVPDGSGITGVTSGGCFLVKNGKIDRALLDYRFVESPWFFLNRVEAVGPTARASLGYSPWYRTWPAPPLIVPPVMVRDFNFVAFAAAA